MRRLSSRSRVHRTGNPTRVHAVSSSARARLLRAMLLVGVAALALGCGSDDPTGTQSLGVACGIDSDCPPGQTCGPTQHCGVPGSNQLPDGGTIADGLSGSDITFGAADSGAAVDGGDPVEADGAADTLANADATGVGSDADAAAATSCVGRCGAVQGGCGCNSGCTAAGTCCDDYDSVCGGRVSGSCKNDTECDDGLACTTGSCVSGACSHKPTSNACLIDDKCVSAGTKGPGICLICAPLAKNTGWTMDVGGACDDGKPCTINDACTASGTCAGTPNPGCCKGDSDCVSTLPCQVGSCDATSQQCTFTAKPGCCTKDTDCTGQPQPCKVLYCNASVQFCDVKAAPEGASCSDGDGCTTNDACSSGFCLGKANTCDDKNPCTADSCQGGACVHTPQTGCGACWDTPAQKPKPKGTACDTVVVGSQRRCGTGIVEQREAVAGCTGVDTTCSQAATNQVWLAWKTLQMCQLGQVCEEKVIGQPTCVASGTTLADLAPQSFKSTTTSYKAGGSVVVTGLLRNLGKATAGASVLEWRLSSDTTITSGDLLLKSVTQGPLAAGGSASMTAVLVLPNTLTSGTWVLGVTADAKNAVKETDEKNNVAVYKITVTSAASPDLVPVGFQSTKTVYAAGEAVVVTGSVKNQGTSASGLFSAEWRLSTNTAITTLDPVLKTLARPSLNPGLSTSTTTSFVLPATTQPGTYYLGLWVDRANQVKESSETNNIATYKITVTAASKVDLLPQFFQTSTTTLAPGAKVTVYGSVKNLGSSTSGAFGLEWRLSTDTLITTGDPLVHSLSRPALAAGQLSSALASFVLPVTTKPGTYYLALVVDRTNVVPETNESNNIALYKVTVSVAAKPDLIPQAFKSAATTYAPGATVTVYGSVKNQGASTAGAFTIEWRLSSNSAISTGDVLLKTLSRSSLSAGSVTSALTSFVLPATTTPGSYYLAIWVDRTNQVSETSTSNNLLTYAITVKGSTIPPKPDLQAVSIKPFTTSLKPGVGVSVTASVKNGGGASGAFSTFFRLSTNTTISASDTLLRIVERTSLAANGTTSVSSYVTIPSHVKAGTYYLGMYVDEPGAVAELSESNNIQYVKVTVTGTSTPKADLVPYLFKTVQKPYAAGDTLSLTAYVRNQGTLAAGTFKVEVRISSNNLISTGDLLWTTKTVTSLNAGALTSVGGALKLPTTLKPGTWYLGVRVDSGSQVAESYESNNISVFPIVIGNALVK